jgi:hypothetical protein
VTKTRDACGHALSGASPSALEPYERALAAFVGWRGGADEHAQAALAEAPSFLMAHLLRAWLLVGGRDPRRLRSARGLLACALGLPANERERGHLAALTAVLADDFELAKVRLGELLRSCPRDVLALHMAHGFDYVTGDVPQLRDRVAAVLPAWSSTLPGYRAVRAMHAFGLAECGEHEAAERGARAVLDADPSEPRAHHVMAHVFEATDRAGEGIRWMEAHAAAWRTGGAATHCGWHLALFHLAQGDLVRALALYDERIRAGRSDEIADLIDAAALLWRLHLRGGEAGPRWAELSAAWSRHIDDRYCSFSDLHAMLAFVGACDADRAQQLEQSLRASQALQTRHAHTTRQVGLPACRALRAFGRQDDGLALTLLANLPSLAHRLGGSHAQRDVLYLTALRAVERIRRRTFEGAAPREAPARKSSIRLQSPFTPAASISWAQRFASSRSHLR